MNRYESVIILSANASEEAMAAFGEKMKELISANGELTNVEEWGKKTFAYDIKKQKEGFYTLFTFSIPHYQNLVHTFYKIDKIYTNSLIKS